MRFQVPQFIETETKIIGPFTLKQFLFLAAGGVILFIVQSFASPIISLLVGIPVLGLAAALAFYKIDGVPLPKYILLSLSFLTGTKRYQFKKDNEFPISNSQFQKK